MMRRALAFGLLAAAPGALPPVGAEIPKLGSVLNSVLTPDDDSGARHEADAADTDPERTERA